MERTPPTAAGSITPSIGDQPVDLDPGMWVRNLAALREADPDTAERIETAAPPAGIEAVAARTRDGGVNFQLRRSDGSFTWLGRSSLPAVRAAELLKQFQSGTGNVLLAGIGEGTEAFLLTQSLAAHRAVFVAEGDAHALQLSLRLRDYTEAFRRKRLVFLLSDAECLGATLKAWLDRHPGHLCPERIMIWPWHSPADANAIRSQVEAAFQQTHARRQQTLAALQAEKFSPQSARSTSLSVAIISLRADEEVWSLASALAEGAGALGWPMMTSTIRGPADLHPLARLTALSTSPGWPPSMAVVLEAACCEVADILPPDVPAIAWLSPSANLENLAARVGTAPVAVTCQCLADQVAAGGVSARQVVVCPPFARDSRPVSHEAADAAADVLVLAALGPVDPASYGYHLPSHVQLWHAVLEGIAAGAEGMEAREVEMLLGACEQKVGVRFEQPELRRSMLNTFLHRVAPSIIAQSLAQALSDAGFKVAGSGGGWEAIDWKEVADIRRAKVIVQADLMGTCTAASLLAAGSGAPLVARRYSHWQQPGGLAGLLQPEKEMAAFTSFSELVARVRKLLADEPLRLRLAEAAKVRCRRDHTPAARLEALRAALTSWRS